MDAGTDARRREAVGCNDVRLRPVSRAEATAPVVKACYDHLYPNEDPAERPENWWAAFANSPAALEHAVNGFLFYQSPQRLLSPLLRELAQTRVGVAAGSEFVATQHRKALADLGESPERVAAVDDWRDSDLFRTTERHVLAFADAIALNLGDVPDEIAEPLLKELGDEAFLELTYITAMYLQHAVMSKALKTEQDA